MEEAVALRAIFGDSFTLVAGLPPDVLDSDIPDPGELAAQGPVHGSRLECQLHVFVDVPVGFRLQVWWRSSGTMCQRRALPRGPRRVSSVTASDGIK